MSEEKREILNMLKEGVINVEDAERLLNALHEGKENKGHNESSKSILDTIVDNINSITPIITESLSDIGPTIQNAINDLNNNIPEDYEEISVSGPSIVLENDTELSIFSLKTAIGDLVINSVEGNEVKILSSDSGIRVYKKEKSVIMRYSGNGLKIAIPDCVDFLKVRILGGQIFSDELNCECDLKTMGGNIIAENVFYKTRLRTMGGNISISLLPNWKEELNAKTMGGSIKLDIPEKISSELFASTMAGKIMIDNALMPKGKNNDKGFTFHKFSGKIGDIETNNTMKLKTMAGDIKLSMKNTNQEEK
ncbi:MAG: hypothetical protein C0601_11755 [Candidatus Muiribacterium halophilum]|uniref:Uncharacterized protein n=1 Tax=Muiribacterium halophilum TaxID=2053465 RepID=A0A2N5ZBC5_MUIH1|nr:MAG: hypothetical protein C0601_11755 [Candidatus Muirbacterium halophilum]